MAINGAMLYWLVCDKCGIEYREYDWAYIIYDKDPNIILQEAELDDWLIEDSRHLCPNCADKEEENLWGDE